VNALNKAEEASNQADEAKTQANRDIRKAEQKIDEVRTCDFFRIMTMVEW